MQLHLHLFFTDDACAQASLLFSFVSKLYPMECWDMEQEPVVEMRSDVPEQYFEFPRTEMLDFLPDSPKTILEIGCGAGSFGQLVKEHHDCEYWGMELDPGAAEIAKQRIDKVFVGQVHETLDQAPDGYFDCFVANDVLEHLVDPYGVLLEVKKKLKPGGAVTASIPNVRHFETMWNLVFKKEWRYQDAGVLDRTHLRFFTESTIRELFTDQGYRVEKMYGINKSDSKFERMCNLLTLGWLKDTLYLQFAVRAVPK
jgi:2-polyprenyl-3-methyl-5-hydroxy-6-metoxy-1,4-benzoquinol methylase